MLLGSLKGFSYVAVEEYNSKGQAGGGCTATTWNLRAGFLRIVSKSSDIEAVITSNELRISTPGTYLVLGRLPVISGGLCKAALRDSISPVITLYGSNSYSAAGDYGQCESFFNGTVVVPEGRTARFSLYEYTSLTRATAGFGQALNINDIDGAALEEKYSQILLIKVG